MEGIEEDDCEDSRQRGPDMFIRNILFFDAEISQWKPCTQAF